MDVQLKVTKRLEIQGKPVMRNPGDWVNVGKQTAMRWIGAGEAWIPDRQMVRLIEDDSGIVFLGDTNTAMSTAAAYGSKVATCISDVPTLKFGRTLLWNPSLSFQGEMLPVGFGLLDRWQIAVPLCDYSMLACHVGTEEDRARTEQVVHDLRIPLYETRLQFVRRSPDMEQFIEQWQEQMADGGDPRQAFLRALYIHKPLILALPTKWWEGRE